MSYNVGYVVCVASKLSECKAANGDLLVKVVLPFVLQSSQGLGGIQRCQGTL